MDDEASTPMTPGGRPSRRLAVAGGLAGLAAASSARAEAAFPARPLMIVSPSNPGGGTDQLARLMRVVLAQEHLSPRPMEVLNRGGAGGTIALAEFVTRRRGDPYTVLAAAGSLITAPIVNRSPFRATDAYPLARLTVDQMVLGVPPNSPYQTIEQFLAALRGNPGAVTWCGGGAGSLDHVFAAMIADACGMKASDLRYIAYSGGGQASAAVMGGQVTVGVTGYTEWRDLEASGRIRILATGAAERFGDKKFPTLREAGIDVTLQNWRGIFVSQGLRPEHLAWWENTVERMRNSDTWQALLTRSGWNDGYLAGEAFRASVRADLVRYTGVLDRLGFGAAMGGGASPVGPYAVPALIGITGLVAAAAAVVEHVRSGGAAAMPAAAEDDDDGGGPLPLWRRFAAGAALGLAYLGGLALTDFRIATPVFLLGLSLILGSKKPILEGLIGVALTFAVWALFTYALHVQLP